MSVIGDVFGSLKSMSELRLLLAFVACIGFAFAQGRLLPSTGRRIAAIAAALAAAGFAFDSADWTQAIMLLGFALVGLGSFVALAWLTSRALGFGAAAPGADAAGVDTAFETAFDSAFDAATSGATQRAARHGAHAHSI